MDFYEAYAVLHFGRGLFFSANDVSRETSVYAASIAREKVSRETLKIEYYTVIMSKVKIRTVRRAM